jgi:hypothetical protein
MSTLYVDNIAPNLGSQVEIPNLKPLAGSVVQVVQGELTTRVGYNVQSFGDVGLQATITPTSATSKILVTLSFGRLQTTQSNGDHGAAIRILRNGVDSDLNGVADGSRPRAAFNVGGHSFNADHSLGGYGITGFDSPNTTSAVTYKVQAWNQSGLYPLYINGTSANGDVFEMYASRTKSFITLMEIAQ